MSKTNRDAAIEYDIASLAYDRNPTPANRAAKNIAHCVLLMTERAMDGAS